MSWLRVFPIIFLAAGVFLMTQVVLPILAFKKWELTFLKDNLPLIAPVNGINLNNLAGVSIVITEGDFPAIVSNIKRRYIQPYYSFALSVPKLNINNAQVEVESNDIDKTLVHLPGTALPGEIGNVFISGHSSGVINLGGDNYYKTIFADLAKLKKGDDIEVVAGGQVFVYQVINFKVVDPKDLSVIAPPDNEGRYITLMTCVPPGLNSKRLIVVGRLRF